MHRRGARHPLGQQSGEADRLEFGLPYIGNLAGTDQHAAPGDQYRLAHLTVGVQGKYPARPDHEVIDVGAALTHRQGVEDDPFPGQFGQSQPHGNFSASGVEAARAVRAERRPTDQALHRAAGRNQALLQQEHFYDRLRRATLSHYGSIDGHGSPLRVFELSRRTASPSSPRSGACARVRCLIYRTRTTLFTPVRGRHRLGWTFTE